MIFSSRSIILALTLFKIAYCSYMIFNNEETAMNGLAFPSTVEVYEGQNVMVTLKKIMTHQEYCRLITPAYQTVNLTINSGRISKWKSDCSVWIQDITLSDEGRWRLQSIKGEQTIEGLFTILVKQKMLNLDQNIIHVDDADTPSIIKFASQNSLYCSVVQDKASEGSFIKGNCSMKVEKTRKNLHGNWKVTLGLPGQVEEITTESYVNIKSEDLDVGVSTDQQQNIAQMYCNLKNSAKILDFCRFERKYDGKGFNLGDGIGKNRYSYYGNGFIQKECGMTIENPAREDYGNWQCNLGYTDGDKTGVLKRILTLERPASRVLRNEEGSHKITLAVKNKPFTIECNAAKSISYCWLRHPNGSIFSANYPTKDDNQLYRFSNNDLDEGKCSVTFEESNDNDNGIWRCNMGQRDKAGIELVDFAELRVGGALAAVKPVLVAMHDSTATIKCVTAEGRRPLKYCRFSLPDGTGFNIDEKITKEFPIMGQYYFDENSTLNQGECAVGILDVKIKNSGNWTCAATMEDDSVEYSDFILLEVTGNRMSTASVTGISFGVVFVAIAFIVVAYVSWKRRNDAATIAAQSSRQAVEPAMVEMSVQYRPSGSTDTSSSEVTIVSPQSSIVPSYHDE